LSPVLPELRLSPLLLRLVLLPPVRLFLLPLVRVLRLQPPPVLQLLLPVLPLHLPLPPVPLPPRLSVLQLPLPIPPVIRARQGETDGRRRRVFTDSARRPSLRFRGGHVWR